MRVFILSLMISSAAGAQLLPGSVNTASIDALNSNIQQLTSLIGSLIAVINDTNTKSVPSIVNLGYNISQTTIPRITTSVDGATAQLARFITDYEKAVTLGNIAITATVITTTIVSVGVFVVCSYRLGKKGVSALWEARHDSASSPTGAEVV